MWQGFLPRVVVFTASRVQVWLFCTGQDIIIVSSLIQKTSTRNRDFDRTNKTDKGDA